MLPNAGDRSLAIAATGGNNEAVTQCIYNICTIMAESPTKSPGGLQAFKQQSPTGPPLALPPSANSPLSSSSGSSCNSASSTSVSLSLSTSTTTTNSMAVTSQLLQVAEPLQHQQSTAAVLGPQFVTPPPLHHPTQGLDPLQLHQIQQAMVAQQQLQFHPAHMHPSQQALLPPGPTFPPPPTGLGGGGGVPQPPGCVRYTAVPFPAAAAVFSLVSAGSNAAAAANGGLCGHPHVGGGAGLPPPQHGGPPVEPAAHKQIYCQPPMEYGKAGAIPQQIFQPITTNIQGFQPGIFNPAALTTLTTNPTNNCRNQNISSHQTHEMTVPNEIIGCVIGKGGSKIAEIRQISGAMIRISNCEDRDAPANLDRTITISGNYESVALAHYLINMRISMETAGVVAQPQFHYVTPNIMKAPVV